MLSAILLVIPLAAGAQSYCSSDGVAQPVAVLERFINADCEACWSDPKSAKAARGELAVDWVVPGSRGDDAPLASVANRDGLARLQALRRKAPAQSESVRHPAQGKAGQLRVSHGLPFNNYLGTSIELKPGTGGPWTAWLLLVETLPAGIEGSPVERNLVRNTLHQAWNKGKSLSKEEQERFFESRPMSIPDGSTPDRLRVVGWVEDARGRIVAAAESRCVN